MFFKHVFISSLSFCSPETFQFFEIMEKLFRAAICRIPGINVEKLADLFTVDHRLQGFTFPSCHDLKRKIFKRFSLFRLRIELDNVNRMRNLRNQYRLGANQWLKTGTHKSLERFQKVIRQDLEIHEIHSKAYFYILKI